VQPQQDGDQDSKRRRSKLSSGLLFHWLLLFLAFAAFGAVAIELYRKGNKDLSAWAVVLTLAVFVVAERLGSMVLHLANSERERVQQDANSERDRRLQEVWQEQRSIMLSKGDIFDLGVPANGLRWLTNALNGNAVYVRDLMIRVNKNASFSDKDAYEKYLATIISFLGNGNRYVVIGNEAGLLSSTQWVTEHFDDHNRANYVRRVTNDKLNFPIVNCVILEYLDNTKEVLFGWDFDNTDVCHVFLTRAPGLVNYFEGLFSACQRYSEDWIPPEKDTTMMDYHRAAAINSVNSEIHANIPASAAKLGS
jgi:hypothetical protein